MPSSFHVYKPNLQRKVMVYMAKHGDLITDGSVTWRVVDRRINGKIADIPNYYQRSALMQGSGSILVTPAVLQVNINDQGFVGGSHTIDLNVTSNWDTASISTGMATQASRAGKDFYVYLIATSTGQLKFLLSSNSTTPSGYGANESRKIGGFHCLCEPVNISGHSLDEAQAGEIIPNSVWDLLHRPISEPEGMVWVDAISKWVDIYLASWSTEESQLVSKYNGDTADGNSTVKFHGEKFVEELGLVNKYLPMRDEFVVFAKGSNEGTNILNSADVIQTGGHVDTNNRRMVSNYGIEDCCGFLWQWVSDIVSYDGSNWGSTSVLNTSVDGSMKYGSSYYHCKRGKVGGSWSNGASCGSRSNHFGEYSSTVNAAYGARGVSDPLYILED